MPDTLDTTPSTPVPNQLTTPSPSPRTPLNGRRLSPKTRSSETQFCTPDTPLEFLMKWRNSDYVTGVPYPTPSRHFESPLYLNDMSIQQHHRTLKMSVERAAIRREKRVYPPHPRLNAPRTPSRDPCSITFSAMTDCIGKLDDDNSASPSSIAAVALSDRHDIALPQPAIPLSGLATDLLPDIGSKPSQSEKSADYWTASNRTALLSQRWSTFKSVGTTRKWKEFNVNTARSNPGFSDLLDFADLAPVPTPPASTNPSLNTLTDLLDSHAMLYTSRLNAALQLTLPSRHMVMHLRRSTSNLIAHMTPDFTSSYVKSPLLCPQNIPTSDAVHVVGLLRNSEVWNTDMISNNHAAHKAYSRGLYELQGHMRAYGCRYGFIMTEVELVCIKLVAHQSSQSCFGPLGVAPAVQLATKGSDEKMSTLLALWHLHMLAGKTSAPGQERWRFDVGTPAQQSRTTRRKRNDSMEATKPEKNDKEDVTAYTRIKRMRREGTPAGLSIDEGSIR